ncbi:MAG: hypothetical protein QOH89_788, partial [Pseudonocardiales bacterium]|nr:hypothetical protein [Pseudonocardiales bacterium]
MTDPAGPYDVRRVGLGPGPAAEELVRRAAGWPGLICLRGAWAGECALLTSHPERMLPAGADPL